MVLDSIHVVLIIIILGLLAMMVTLATYEAVERSRLEIRLELLLAELEVERSERTHLTTSVAEATNKLGEKEKHYRVLLHAYGKLKASSGKNAVFTPDGDYKITYYTLHPDECGKQPDDPAYGITASGVRAEAEHTVAVDPTVIPLGTRIYIKGLGYRVAEDTGSGVKGKHIDVFLGSPQMHAEAKRRGVETRTVYMVKENEQWQTKNFQD